MTMSTSTILTSFVLATAMVGCAEADPDIEARDDRIADEFDDLDEPTETKAFDGYYTVTADVRRCAFPRCGGWFVTSVNDEVTACADGTESTSCYVAELSLPRDVTVNDGDLVHGELRRVSLSGETFGSLDVDLAYESTLETPAWKGSHSLFYATDVVCVTTPCPELAQATLNTGDRAMDPLFRIMADDPANDERLEDAFWTQYEADRPLGGQGVLTQGKWGSSTDGEVYSIFDVYTVKQPYAPVCVVQDLDRRTTAWNFDTEREAIPLLDQLEGQVTLMTGTCKDQLASMTCTMEYMPVHGFIDEDASTCQSYPNDCQFRVGVITAAGEKDKASGEWSDGMCLGQGSSSFSDDLDTTEPRA